ncbi:MAG TPA: hypothetical protein VNZ45_08400 [Bacteroidia bacterium]|jgi:hypothetical protein|nr:hypothetical protein [Bacteroidia bacterium]
MKTSKSLVLFVSLCAVAALYSCKSGGSDSSKMFVKKWQIESFKSKDMDDRMAMAQKMMDTIKDSSMKAQMASQLKMQQSTMEDMKKTVLTCNADGTCEISMNMMGKQTTNKAKWTMTPDGKKVVLSDSTSPKPDTMNIVELTSEKMTVGGPDGKGGTVYTTFKAIQ